VLQENLIRELRSQSTWRLLGLAVITYGVYYAHYIAQQTRTINVHVPDEVRISPAFVVTIVALSYLTLGLFIGCLFVDDQHPIAIASNVLEGVWSLLILVWGFFARSRVNMLTAAQRGNPNWFSGLWTLLFTPLYFNYKINVLTSGGENQRVAA